MIALTVREIIIATGGVLLNGDEDTLINGITIDSRKIDGNDLFIPLIGENFDGHKFIADSVKKGIKAILISKSEYAKKHNVLTIQVNDTLKALQNIAKYYISKFNIPIIAVTGSTGKTSTKDLITSVLKQKYKTLSNIGNFNNHIGVPLTVFSLESDHEVAVIEMGMSNLGEIDLLADIVRPDIGVITNIGLSHIEHLKTQQNIMNAKMEIANYFNESSMIIVNGDDKYLKKINDTDLNYKKCLVGLDKHNSIQGVNIKDMGIEGTSFDIVYEGNTYPFIVKAPGIHNVYNALCAFVVAITLGVSIQLIQKGISQYKSSHMRLNVFTTDKDIVIINDAYNASPDSMKAALSVLAKFNEKRKIAILGDMLEMGKYTEQGHYDIGCFAAENTDILITVGKSSKFIAKGAEDRGFEKSNIFVCTDNEQAKSKLNDLLKKGDTVLVKGSRGMKMEEIVEYIQERS